MFVAPAFDACQDVRHKLSTGANVSEHAQHGLQKKGKQPCTYRANACTGCMPYGDDRDQGVSCQRIAVFSTGHYRKL